MEGHLKVPQNYEELIHLIEEFYLAEVYHKSDKDEMLKQRQIISNLIDKSKIYTDFNKQYLSAMFKDFNDRVEEIAQDVSDAAITSDEITVNFKDGSQYVQKMTTADEILLKYTKIPAELFDIALYTLEKDMVAIGVQCQEAILKSNKERQS